MKTFCSSLICLPLLVFVGGCDGGDESGSSGPKGDHHTYVVSALDLPVTAVEAGALGADLDGDSTVDNQVGTLLTFFTSAFLDVPGGAEEGVLRGETLLLVDVQATDLTDAGNVGFATYPGADSLPAPCVVQTDLATCGQHLAGTGSFSVVPGSGREPIVGDIESGAFDGSGGRLHASFAIAHEPVELTLDLAFATADAISETAITSGRLGGAIDHDAFQVSFFPAIQPQIDGAIVRDCVGGPGCGCMGGSTGELFLLEFDDDANCTVSLLELQASSLFDSDVDVDGDGTNDSLSIGLGFTAVAATFTPPE